MGRSDRLNRFLKSFTWRMTLGSLAINVLLIPMLFGGGVLIVSESYRSGFIDDNRMGAHFFASLISHDFYSGKREGLLDDIMLGPNVIFSEIRNDKNKVIVSEYFDDSLKNKPFREDFFLGQHGDDVYYIAAPILDPESNNSATLRLGFDETPIKKQIATTYKRGAWLALAYLSLYLALSAIAGSLLTRSLGKVRRAAQKVASGQFSEKLIVKTNIVEVASLAEDLEKMRMELEGQHNKIAVREERLRSIIDHSMDGIITFDEQGIIESFNQAASVIFGYSPDEAIGRSINTLIASEELEAHKRELKPDGINPEGGVQEMQGRASDGAEFPIELALSEMRIEKKRMFVCMVRNITERKKVENAFRNIATGFSSVTGEEFFDKVVCHLSKTLDADYAFIGELTGENQDKIRVVSICSRERKLEPFEYDLAHTPCETVVGHDACCYTSGVQDKFPDNLTLKEMKLESYIGTPLFEKTGRPSGLMVLLNRKPITNTKITVSTLMVFADRVAAELERGKIEKELKLASKVFETAVEGVMITNLNVIIQSVNPAFTHITGYSEEEIIGKKPNILSSKRHDKSFYNRMWGSLHETGRWQGEIWNRRKNGESFLEGVTITAIKDSEGKTTQYAAVFNDITNIRRNEEEIKYQAYHDLLTGLPNRSVFLDRLDNAIARSERDGHIMAVLFLDLDNFKQLNDTLGHTTGDLLLKGISMRLVGCLREVDTVSRFSGDEFTVYLENINRPEDALVATRKILNSISEPFMLDGKKLYTTACVGITIYPNDGAAAEDLIKNADLAMYHAKKAGKNGYRLFNREMNEKLARRLALEQEIRNGLENDEFLVYYQPKVNLQSGDISGMEALVRWRRPDGTVISPDDFIPLAEETGLIRQIGERVLFEACCYAKELYDQGYPDLILSVNLSARQLDQENLLAMIRSTLEVVGLKPEGICLELTESALMRDVEAALVILNDLKKMNVKISMDDFGTGYSSLSHLKKLPIYELKIDRSFIRGLPYDQDSATIAEAIISMAKALNLHVVAEGVENENQAEYLKSIGCAEVQGYFFSRPVNKREFYKLLLGGKCAANKN